MPKAPSKTNAVRILDRAGISYDMLTYEVDESDLSAIMAAEKLALPVESVFKTLVARNDLKEILLACIPANSELDLKSLASAAGCKRTELVAISELQKLTGYVRGGCSPLGTKKPFRLFVDETCDLHNPISISAGLRGVQILIAPHDLVTVSNASVAPIAR